MGPIRNQINSRCRAKPKPATAVGLGGEAYSSDLVYMYNKNGHQRKRHMCFYSSVGLGRSHSGLRRPNDSEAFWVFSKMIEGRYGNHSDLGGYLALYVTTECRHVGSRCRIDVICALAQQVADMHMTS